ncbi:hypothetical protein OMW55_09160 [Sphingomonas sp. BN140010]|uniref:Uncharacterized protein n=1 Tax=Sphingomonas arvum TaxID=2992113 RepID=A0ABT3JFW3_9SPHN|nr:hypothetical protein [Sphingomonas sp. BN140010]MCW3797970.1 hypothetical protein [Sphingomonas sp. BN140010]
MNAPVTAIQKPPFDDYTAMMAHAEQWRGECIQHFAELEQIIETLLIGLKGTGKGARKIKTGEPVGSAFGQLRELTGEKGLFGAKAGALSASLGKLAPDFEWRAHLTHGMLKVWEGRGAKWLLTFAHRPVGGETIRMHAQTWAEACDMRDRLAKAVQVVRAQAGSLRAAETLA